MTRRSLQIGSPIITLLTTPALVLLSIAVALSVFQPAVGEFSSEIQRVRNKSRSQIALKSGRQTVEIFLLAEDEKMEILESPYCGGKEGDKQYTGNYQLISALEDTVISKIPLGKEYTFTEGKQHDGLREFAVPGTKKQLIAIYQYRSCNNDEVEFYRVDDGGRLHKVRFLNKDGLKEASQSTGGDILVSGKQMTFCSYNNAVGHEFCDSYVYDGENLIQTASLMTQDLKAEQGTIIPEARRVLFDFLRDHGLIAERFVVKDIHTHDEVKFIVSGRTTHWQDFQIDGKSEFEFRVKRLGNDFKVLDPFPSLPQIQK